ncbi:MAG TPA: BCCT family transporter, partial [Arenimonas sp.]
EFFSHLPLASITSLLATILVVTFFVTSSDSGALVVDMLTTGGAENSPVWQRVFWSVLMGVVAAVLLVAGGLSALQTASIASALPFTAVMALVCWGLLKALQTDAAKRSSLQFARTQAGGTGDTWQQRLRTLVHQPTRAEVAAFLEGTVVPALDQVAEELRRRGVDASREQGEDGRTALVVKHAAEPEFRYVVRPRPYDPPSFVMRDTRSERSAQLRYYRAEVHLMEGGQDYDIMNWSRDGVINDVLDQYERHLHFMAGLRG